MYTTVIFLTELFNKECLCTPVWMPKDTVLAEGIVCPHRVTSNNTRYLKLSVGRKCSNCQNEHENHFQQEIQDSPTKDVSQ